jgi:branched-chain amino acid transport system substrate-binding protein
MRTARAAVGGLVAALALGACGVPAGSTTSTIKVGAVFPLTGVQAPLARHEYQGVEVARDLVNADGGVDGRPISLITRDLTAPEDAQARVDELKRAGASAVIGAYSSSLSLTASAAAQARGLLYWEAGAVADQLTGEGRPLVFRVGATGKNLGSLSSHFAAMVLGPRLGRSPSQLRLALVHDDDLYPMDVAAAVRSQARAEGMTVVADVTYHTRAPDWDRVLAQLRDAHPDILLLSSYIDDGVAFRRAMLRSGLHVSALIGTTMAQCVPEFGAMMGADAIGVFASDRPPKGFNPTALNSTGKAAYDRFAAAYRARYHEDPDEEALSGFAAAWALFHYVMPAAQRNGELSASGMARAARGLNLQDGTLANGAGARFGSAPSDMGQNLRAASVIWQWQGIRHSVTVYPPVFATGTPGFIPLPR